MLKWIGAICIVAGSGLSGIDVYKQRKKELETTEAFLKTIVFMKEEMHYTKTMIEAIFLKCACMNNITSDFYSNIATGIKNGKVLNQLWKDEIEYVPNLNDALKPDLMEIGEVLGAVELDMQDNLISYKIEKIGHIKEELEQDLKGRYKVYPKIGFGVGAMLAVLLI